MHLIVQLNITRLEFVFCGAWYELIDIWIFNWLKLSNMQSSTISWIYWRFFFIVIYFGHLLSTSHNSLKISFKAISRLAISISTHDREIIHQTILEHLGGLSFQHFYRACFLYAVSCWSMLYQLIVWINISLWKCLVNIGIY